MQAIAKMFKHHYLTSGEKLSMRRMSFKSDVADLLAEKFGRSTRALIMKNYTDDDPQEIYEVAEHMLEGFMGRKAAEKALEKLIIKYGNKLNKGVNP